MTGRPGRLLHLGAPFLTEGLELRLPRKLLSLAGLVLFLTCGPFTASAADFSSAGVTDPAPVTYREALSRYLSLEMVRATFDVVARDDLEALLEAQAVRWHGAVPTAAELADIDGQLLAEASYYIVSLTYLVQVGGAVFPSDKAEAVYANDTIVRLDDLRRQLFEAIQSGSDIVPILAEVERIRALTEGYTSIPNGFGVFDQHGKLLDAALTRQAKGTPA